MDIMYPLAYPHGYIISSNRKAADHFFVGRIFKLANYYKKVFDDTYNAI
jgi:hypothetical protein